MLSRAGQAVGGDLTVWSWIWGLVGFWGLFGVGRGVRFIDLIVF